MSLVLCLCAIQTNLSLLWSRSHVHHTFFRFEQRQQADIRRQHQTKNQRHQTEQPFIANRLRFLFSLFSNELREFERSENSCRRCDAVAPKYEKLWKCVKGIGSRWALNRVNKQTLEDSTKQRTKDTRPSNLSLRLVFGSYFLSFQTN